MLAVRRMLALVGHFQRSSLDALERPRVAPEAAEREHVGNGALSGRQFGFPAPERLWAD